MQTLLQTLRCRDRPCRDRGELRKVTEFGFSRALDICVKSEVLRRDQLLAARAGVVSGGLEAPWLAKGKSPGSASRKSPVEMSTVWKRGMAFNALITVCRMVEWLGLVPERLIDGLQLNPELVPCDLYGPSQRDFA